GIPAPPLRRDGRAVWPWRRPAPTRPPARRGDRSLRESPDHGYARGHHGTSESHGVEDLGLDLAEGVGRCPLGNGYHVGRREERRNLLERHPWQEGGGGAPPENPPARGAVGARPHYDQRHVRPREGSHRRCEVVQALVTSRCPEEHHDALALQPEATATF